MKQALESNLARSNESVFIANGIPMVKSALKLSDSAIDYSNAPPELAAHSREILNELGLDYAQYTALGVVK